MLAAFRLLAEREGILSALEPAHALAWVIKAARSGELEAGSTVLVTLSGRGDKDVAELMELVSTVSSSPHALPPRLSALGRHEPGRPAARSSAALRSRSIDRAVESCSSPTSPGGLGPEWLEVLRAVVAAGADAVEVGIPFSDPVMDGPVIQEASVRALAEGATPDGIVSSLSNADVEVPLAVMTYVNLVAHGGYRGFALRLKASGVAAAIVPDLPYDDAGEWLEEADAADVETVLLVAPTTTPARLGEICARSRGFLYAVGRLGVTGERTEVASSALEIARRAKEVTDLPVLVGVGVSDARQAREICAVADGVVVGAALIRRLLDGASPDEAAVHLRGCLRPSFVAVAICSFKIGSAASARN